MATTSLWHIEGRLKDLINYVENPEKTVAKTPELQDLYNVFSYVQRPEATQEGEYVTALNCLKETELKQKWQCRCSLSRWVVTMISKRSPHISFASFTPISWASCGVTSSGLKLW